MCTKEYNIQKYIFSTNYVSWFHVKYSFILDFAINCVCIDWNYKNLGYASFYLNVNITQHNYAILLFSTYNIP